MHSAGYAGLGGDEGDPLLPSKVSILGAQEGHGGIYRAIQPRKEEGGGCKELFKLMVQPADAGTHTCLPECDVSVRPASRAYVGTNPTCC